MDQDLVSNVSNKAFLGLGLEFFGANIKQNSWSNKAVLGLGLEDGAKIKHLHLHFVKIWHHSRAKGSKTNIAYLSVWLEDGAKKQQKVGQDKRMHDFILFFVDFWLHPRAIHSNMRCLFLSLWLESGAKFNTM